MYNSNNSLINIKSDVGKYIKKVAFAKIVNIILIPCIQEYIDFGIANDIWLNKDEYPNYNNDD